MQQWMRKALDEAYVHEVGYLFSHFAEHVNAASKLDTEEHRTKRRLQAEKEFDLHIDSICQAHAYAIAKHCHETA